MATYMERKNLANVDIDDARKASIADGVRRVLDGIGEAAQRAGRDVGEVSLLAATKTRDVGEIMAAIDAGVRMIGENRPQEVAAKAEGLRRLCAERRFALGVCDDAGGRVVADGDGHDGSGGHADHGGAGDRESGGPVRAESIGFHLIGQLQSNKIGKVLPAVDVVESVDSLELAERIARRAVARGIEVGVMLEVNESGEASKSGCEPAHAILTAQRIAAMGGLRLQGLMTVGAHVEDRRTIAAGFAHLRRTRDAIVQSGVPGTEQCRALSMGMTADMDIAIAEGSTIVRVGTAIFGERAYI